MTATRPRPRGFTLIELMVVVTIVGILASVAIPEFYRLTLRAKEAERGYVIQRIKRAVADYMVRNARLPDGTPPYTYVFTGYNPAYPPTGNKRAWDFAATGWNQIVSPGEIEGSLYYSYLVNAWDGPGNSYLYVYAVGDLDGDGAQAWKYVFHQRVDGVYQVQWEWPPVGQEDLYGF